MKQMIQFKYKFGILLMFLFLTVGLKAQVTISGSVTNYTTIQSAIDNAVNGDTVFISDGTYSEVLSVAVGVSIKPAPSATSVIVEGSISILSDDVTIDGISLTNPSGKFGITSIDYSNITLKNLNIIDIGSADASSSGTNYGIAIVSSAGPVDNIVIEDNTILGISGGNFKSANGIAVGYSTGNDDITNLVIQNNSISYISSSTAAFGSGGRGAYGILLNHGTGITAKTVSPMILNNTIENLEGLWSHGIGLEGNTPNALVEGNTINNLVDYKSPGDPDAVGVMIEDNASAATVTIRNNDFTNLMLGVRNETTISVDARSNWWGDASGPYHSTNLTGTGVAVSDSVKFNPWLGNSINDPHDSENPWTVVINPSNPSGLEDLNDFVQDGDTVIVLGDSTYTYASFSITKSIIIAGNGAKINHGSPAITVAANNVTITGFTFNFGTSDYAIQVNDGYDGCVVRYCNFLTTNGINNLTTVSDTVDARFNWWGDISGPTHSSNPGGTGSIISDHVRYKELLSPYAFEGGVSIEPTFVWVSDPGATSYTLEVATDEAFTNIVFDTSGLASSTFDMTTVPDILLNNTSYFWRVYATNAYSVNTTSVASKFTTAINVTPYLAAPVSGLQINSPTVQLYWNVSGSSTSNLTYDVFYSSNYKSTYAGDESASLKFSGIVNQTISVTGLTPGTTWYWQIRARTSEGAIVGYSTVESFVTYGVLTEPVPIFPLNGSASYTSEPYLYWTSYNYSTLIEYKVRYSTNPSVDINGVLDTDYSETALTYNLYAQLIGLNGGETYYWQVAATNDGGSTLVYSGLFNFTTPTTVVSGGLQPPSLSYPINGVTVYATSVTFYWLPSDYNNTLQYEVRYAEDSSVDGGGMLDDASAVSLPLTSSYYKQAAGLDGNSTYYWQVRTYNGSSYSDWSSVEDFVTFESTYIVQTPVLIIRVDGALENSLQPTLFWYVNGIPTGYDFTISYNTTGAQDLSGNLTGTSNVLGGSTTTSSLFAQFVSTLTEGETYYWQVKATKNATDKYSEIRSFTINTQASASSPLIPIPTSPIGGITVSTLDPTLNWVVYGVYSNLEFQVLYSTDNTTSGGVLQNGTSSTAWTSDLSTALSGLTPGATYYWQVRSRFASSPSTISDYSSVQVFAVSAGASPVMSILGSPIDGVQVTTENPVLSWTNATESLASLTYDLEIADNPEMTAAQVMKNVGQTNYRLNNLPAGNYYWRVRSKTTEGDYSYYTGNGRFVVNGKVTNTEAENSLPTEFELSQNYPNPFNPTTNIKFSLPEASQVVLKIYDMLGREIKTLINENRKAGSFDITWNGTDNSGRLVSSGVYIYRIIAGKYIESRKMNLIK